MNYENGKIVLIVLMILIMYVMCINKKESFVNLLKTSNKNYGYNNLTDNSGPYYSYSQKNISQLDGILLQLIDEINRQSNSNFYLGNIENITVNKVGMGELNYIVDVFLFEHDKDYTLRTLMNFNVNGNKQVQVNSISRGNAFKYDMNDPQMEDHPQVFNHRLSRNNNFKDIYTIKGVNNSTLEFTKADNSHIPKQKEVPTPAEFDSDILPMSIQEDSLYKSEQNRKLLLQNVVLENRPNCWNADGIRNEDPHNLSCNTFQREQEPLIDAMQPRFNSSIHKNISDDNESKWLFSPTRLEVDHNL